MALPAQQLGGLLVAGRELGFTSDFSNQTSNPSNDHSRRNTMWGSRVHLREALLYRGVGFLMGNGR